MKTCPSCGYVRKESDAIIRDTECPKCGIIYDKWTQQSTTDENKPVKLSFQTRSEKKSGESKTLIERNIVLAVVAVLIIAIVVPQIIIHLRSGKREIEIPVIVPGDENKQSQDRRNTAYNPTVVIVDNSFVAKELSISDIIRENRESIVLVKTQTGIGSGFFIGQNGLVVTNRHVLPQGEQAEIKTIRGTVFKVNRIVYEDAQADLVIVSTSASQQESKPVKLSSKLPDVGEKVIVIGNPLGLEQTVSDGIVSAVRRNQHSVDFIQITAPVSPGNSGGPLFNMRGEVIGVATFQYKSGQNLNFCVGASRIAGMQNGTNTPSTFQSPGDIKSPGGQDVYCYADSNGQVSFVDWKTGLLISRPDGSLDRAKYESWVFEQVGGHPDNINPDKEAREDLERNREKLFKNVFPHRSLDDTNLTSAEKEWLERRYQRYYVEAYNQAVFRRNEAISKYRSMMHDFDKFAATRRK